HHRALLDSRRRVVPDHERHPAERRAGAAFLLARAGGARRSRRQRLGSERLARRRRLGGRARGGRGARIPTRHRPGLSTIDLAMAEERELSLQDQLEEIGTQLDWVRGYL